MADGRGSGTLVLLWGVASRARAERRPLEINNAWRILRRVSAVLKGVNLLLTDVAEYRFHCLTMGVPFRASRCCRTCSRLS